MRPRLCMVVHGPYPVGEPRVAREVRVALAEGFDVDVVALRRPNERPEELVGGARVFRLPLEHRRGGGPLRVMLEYAGFALLAAARLTAAARRYTVVHVHNPPDFLLIAGLTPRLLGARVVFDVHDLSTDMFAMRFQGRIAAVALRVLRVVERWATRFADSVITVHEPYRRELIARGVSPEKVVVVMNAVDEHLLPERQSASVDGGFRIVYHGTVTPEYGVGMLVEAVARIRGEIPSLSLEIYGEGDAVETVRATAHSLGIADRVAISGCYLPHRQVLARVADAAVGVVPNLPTPLNRFALSSKLFEYVALGIPVVSADLPTLREHFDDREVRFFRAGDADSLADALLEIARDPAAAAQRAEAALRRYQAYRWPVSAERYASVLRSLTSARSANERAIPEAEA